MPKTGNNSVKLKTLMEQAQVLLNTTKESDYSQGGILNDQYQKLYDDLISIDPEAKKTLPHDPPRGPGMFVVNLEDERKKAILGSSQMVGYLRVKLSFSRFKR